MRGFRLRLPPGLDGAFWAAVLLIGLAELALHSEAVMYRYRAVLAQGRAYDKLLEAERFIRLPSCSSATAGPTTVLIRAR